MPLGVGLGPRIMAVQTKTSDIPACLAMSLAVRTAVENESSPAVLATVMVRPRGCLSSAYSSPYMTSTYFCPAGISFCDEMYSTLGIGRPLRFSDCSEPAPFVRTAGVAGPLVDLTMM